MPLTGGQALYGNDQVKAAQWAVDAINAKGGINGKKLEMIMLDTQADPQVGIQAVNRLISVDKVPGLHHGMVGRRESGRADRQRQQGRGAFGRRQLAGHLQARRLRLHDVPARRRRYGAVAHYSGEKMGKKKAAVLFINNETGIGAAKVYSDTFTKAGGEVVAYEAYDQKATDFTGPLLKIRAAKPDIIHLHGLVAEIPQVIAQMRQLGINRADHILFGHL